MTVTTVLRSAIVGTGRIANTYDDEIVDPRPSEFYQGENRHVGLYTLLPVNHAAAYASEPGFELVAAANRGQEKLQAFGQRRGVDALYTDFREMLRHEAPDVVSVCTQSDQKAEVVIACAEAGVRAVIVEKAMATSMAEADAMIAACEENDVLLAVNHPYRFSPMIRRIKALIDQDALGSPGTFTAHALGGVLHVGTHIFDLAGYWLGEIEQVGARIPDYLPHQDLSARGMMHFRNGVTGFFDFTHGAQPSLEVRAKQGYITISTMVGDGWLHRIEPMFAADAKRRYPNRLRIEPIDTGEPRLSPTQRLLREVGQSLQDGSPFISTGRDGAAALEVGIACHLSQREQSPISLPLNERTFRVPNR